MFYNLNLKANLQKYTKLIIVNHKKLSPKIYIYEKYFDV